MVKAMGRLGVAGVLAALASGCMLCDRYCERQQDRCRQFCQQQCTPSFSPATNCVPNPVSQFPQPVSQYPQPVGHCVPCP